MKTRKLIIIGSGPAGFTAAIYAARAELQPLLFEGPEPGGQLVTTSEVENFPGFPKGILGPELMDNMKEQAKRFGTEIRSELITSVDFSKTPFVVKNGNGQEFAAESVIVATGASAMWLNIPSEQKLRGKGVSACATCDGFFFKNKVVAVVGGGDTAMEEALFLTKFATHVHVLVRKDKLRASKIMAERAQADKKITFHWSVEIQEVLGEHSVSGLRLKNTVDGTLTNLEVQGLFLAIGHKPNTEPFVGQLAVDAKGYLVVHDQVLTDKAGVFVAGDVSDYRFRQAVTAAGWGCMATIEAEKFLAHAHA